MKKIFVLSLGIIAAVLFFPKAALAGQVLVYPEAVADTYIDSNNYQTRGSETTAYFGYFSDTFESDWAFFKFNVNIPAGATIDHAYLRVMGGMCSGSPNPTNFTVAQVTGDWNEQTLNWGNRPTIGKQVTQNSSCLPSTSYVNYSIKDIAVNWNNGAPNYGVALYGPKNNNWYRVVKTRESGASSAPMMILYYTVPDTIAPTNPSGNSSSGGVATSTTSSPTAQSKTGVTTSTSHNPAATNATNQNNQGSGETEEDLTKLVKELSAGEKGMNFWDKIFVSWFYLGPILAALFWILVVTAIVLLIVRHNKKKKAKLAAQTQPTATPPQPVVPTSTALETPRTPAVDTVAPVVNKPESIQREKKHTKTVQKVKKKKV